MTNNRPSHTRAGDKLVFHFQNTEIGRLIFEAVEKIEIEAYTKGYDDGQQDEPNLDTPVMFPEDDT